MNWAEWGPGLCLHGGDSWLAWCHCAPQSSVLNRRSHGGNGFAADSASGPCFGFACGDERAGSEASQLPACAAWKLGWRVFGPRGRCSPCGVCTVSGTGVFQKRCSQFTAPPTLTGSMGFAQAPHPECVQQPVDANIQQGEYAPPDVHDSSLRSPQYMARRLATYIYNIYDDSTVRGSRLKKNTQMRQVEELVFTFPTADRKLRNIVMGIGFHRNGERLWRHFDCN